LTNKEKALSGSIGPLRGNEETKETSLAFEISVAGDVPSFVLAFGAKTEPNFPYGTKLALNCLNLEQLA